MKPIITSLLDTDFYKFTMGQIVFNNYSDVHVSYAFKNRTKSVRIADCIDIEELRRQLDHVMALRFNKTEIHYLRGTNEYQERMFSEDYLQFLMGLRFPPYDLSVSNGNLRLEFSGKWPETIYWETFALSIVNELYFRSLLSKISTFEKEYVFASGVLRLAEKIKKLKENGNITFTDFGTRRRFSRKSHDYIVKTLVNELSEDQFLGTSNTYLAKKYGILPMGTSAHEMFMVVAGMMSETNEWILNATNKVLDDWWEQYGKGLSVALTDTFGTDLFFNCVPLVHARNWKGLRQDSGDPIEFGEKAIKFYESHGIDPTEKIIVFSDGLDIDKIVKIASHFKGRIKCTFGWGTNLTNDFGFPALSLVVKAVKANGKPLVKLSDNLAKAIGEPREIERYKRVCGYTNTAYEECRY